MTTAQPPPDPPAELKAQPVPKPVPKPNPKPKWPHAKRACIAVTMDNMGEAADLHRGIWPASAPIGAHPSVTNALPQMLALLARHGVRATYFIEAWNCEPGRYGRTVAGLQSGSGSGSGSGSVDGESGGEGESKGEGKGKGHEVGFHAYQHEVWRGLDAAAERANLDRGVAAAAAGAGVVYSGFRPPGGLPTPRTLGLLRERGFTYLSPAAARPAVVEGVAIVPFQWESIDAYFYMEATAALRVGKGDGEGVLGPEVLRERLLRRVDEVVDEGGFLALLFHPFLQTDERRMEVMEEVVAYVKSKEKEEGVWIAQCRDVADWILANPESFGDDPGWDMAEWKKK
ncbi:hypothetical protein MBLNU459_g3029t1 [Dothideomycetes sp. NU459]